MLRVPPSALAQLEGYTKCFTIGQEIILEPRQVAQAHERNQRCNREDVVQQAGPLQLWQVRASPAEPWGCQSCLYSPLQPGSWRGEMGAVSTGVRWKGLYTLLGVASDTTGWKIKPQRKFAHFTALLG